MKLRKIVGAVLLGLLVLSMPARADKTISRGGARGLSEADGDTRYVNVTGDTMTGDLINTAQIKIADGTVSAPSLTPTSIGNSGWYIESSLIKMSIFGVESIIYGSGNINFKKDILLSNDLTVNGSSIFGNSGIDSATFIGRDVFFPNLAVHTYAGATTINWDGATTLDAAGQTVGTEGLWDFNVSGLPASDLRVRGDTDTDLLFVDASADFVGIGTNTPGKKLDVVGEIRSSGNITASTNFVVPQTEVVLRVSSTIAALRGTVNGITIPGTSATYKTGSTSKVLPYLTETADTNTGFWGDGADAAGITTAGVIRLEATPTGEVGIGGMTTVDELLHTAKAVSGIAVGLLVENSQANSAASTDETAEIHFGFGGINSVASISVIKEQDYTSTANEDSAMAFSIDINGILTEQFRVDSASFFGIDTTTPDSKLDIEEGAITIDEIAAPATPATDRVTIYAKAGGGVFSKNDAGDEFDLTIGGGTKEVSVAVAGNTDIKGDRAVKSLTTNGVANFTLPIPVDFVSLVALDVMTIPGTTGSGKDVDLTSDYSAAGEAFDANSESNTTITYVFTTDQLDAFDVSSVATGIAAGDTFGLQWNQNSAGSNDMVCLRMRYN